MSQSWHHAAGERATRHPGLALQKLTRQGTPVKQQQTKIFRQHDAVPAAVTSTLYRALTAEWVTLNGLPSSRRSLHRWARTETVLAGLENPGAVVDAIDAADKERTDELLAALIRLSQTGNSLAGRIVLQAMLPKLTKIAVNAVTDPGTPASIVEDRRHETIAEFWTVLAGYPVARRTRSIAGNLALDTLNRVVKPHRHIDRLRRDGLVVPWTLFDENATAVAPAAVGLNPDGDLLDVIVWGAQHGAITRDEAQLLTTVYLPSATDGWGFDQAAADLGTTRAAVRQRCSRAVRRLTDAVRAELAAMDSALAA